MEGLEEAEAAANEPMGEMAEGMENATEIPAPTPVASGRGRGGGSSRGRGGFRGGLRAGERPVEESMRIDISGALRAFQESGEESYVFPPGLSNHDRAVVHAEVRTRARRGPR